MAEGYPTRSLRELTRVLFSRLAGILVILVVVVGAVAAASLLARWQYRSSALLLARPVTPVATAEGPASLRDRLSLFVATQRQWVRSDFVLTSALMRMADVAPDGAAGPDGRQWYAEEAVFKYAAEHAAEVARCRGRVKLETPGGPDATFTQTFTVMVDWPEERQLARRAGEKDPREFATKRAQAFATYLLSAYQARRAAVEATHAKQSADRATVVAQANLEGSRKALEDYVATELKGDLLLVQNMLGGIGEVGPQSLSTRFQAEVNGVEARLGELSSLAKTLAEQFSVAVGNQTVPVTRALLEQRPELARKLQTALPQELLRANPALAKTLDAITDLRLKLHNLEQQYTPAFKTFQHAQRELAANTADLKGQIDTMIRQERAALEARLKEFNRMVARDKSRVVELAVKAAQYKRLKDTFENAQKIFNQRQAEAIAAQSAGALAALPVEVRVVDRPSRPDRARPHRPILWLNILVGAVAGVILSLIYAFLADHYDHSLKGMDDVERHVGVDVLASIPRYRRRIIRTK